MWPDKVLRQFGTVPQNPSESDFHGPYNKLLNDPFPTTTDFTVVPQYIPDSRGAADFIVVFEILHDNHPVLILQLKPPGHLSLRSKRQAADDQIRQHMLDLVEICPIDTLHAISALGTKLCFYTLDTTDEAAQIAPAAIPARPTMVNDPAPANRWDADVLEDEGEAQLRQTVTEIKDKCAALNVRNPNRLVSHSSLLDIY